MWQTTCGVVIRPVRNENGTGGSSPGWTPSPRQSIVVPSSRGGVPVLRRPSEKPQRASVRDSPSAGASPTRPAGIFSFPSLSLQVQEVLRRDPLSGQLFCFRGRRGDLLKVIWHDGQGACLFTKRLERGRFLWPSASDGAVTISSAQLGYLLSGIDWRNPQETWRPTSVG